MTKMERKRRRMDSSAIGDLATDSDYEKPVMDSQRGR